ncbi:MAG: hypothetical protein ABEH43_04990 [Flavobacteriales bacterium]
MGINQLKEIISKFLFPTLLIVAGILLLNFGNSSGQNNWFMLASAAVLVTGIISVLFSLGYINKIVQYILFVLLFIGVIFMGFLDYKSIEKNIQYKKEKKRRKKLVIQSLKDIRKAQEAYKSRYQKFTGDFDTLVNFVKSDSISYERIEGRIPDTLDEQEALEAGIISKDTFFVKVKDSLFDFSKKERQKRQFAFNADSLPYEPVTHKKFKMDAGFVKSSSGVRRPVFEVKEPTPFHKKGFPPPDTLKVGSMDKASTSGNWGE